MTDPDLARDDKQRRALMRCSCAFYAHEQLRGPQSKPYNGRFLVSHHHEEWDELISTKRRVAILAPRDHGKTYLCSFAFPLWKAEHVPNGRGYVFSATQDQAVRILADIKDELEDNPRLRHLLPTKREVWSKTSIKLANGHRIYARGYGTKIRGAHPDWIVVDDGLNDEDAYSELVRNKHIDYFYTAISNMVVPTGQIIVVGTPFHATDLYGDLERNPEYVFRRYPAVDAGGKALWPARYDADTLARKRREIGSVRFTREFLCQPVSDDMSIFPERLFRGEPQEQYAAKLGLPASYWNQHGVTRRFIGVDLALSTTTSADYMVVFVLGLDAMGNRWVIDIIRKQGLPFQQQLSLIQATGRRYDADLIYIESNQMQRVFGDELIRTTDLPIRKFTTTGTGRSTSSRAIPSGNTTSANKNSLEGGVPSLRVLLENGKLRIPRGDKHSVETTDIWINEMKCFTWLDGKMQGVGSHDDTVMAFWIADQAVRHGGFSFATGDDDVGSVDDLLREQMYEPEGTREDVEETESAAIERILGIPAKPESETPKASGSLVDEDAEGEVIDSAAWSRLPGLYGRF